MLEHNAAEAQQILAQRIINSAMIGEWDAWKLAREALFHLWEVQFTGKPLIKFASPNSTRVCARARL
jgi:hypothetical protein